jgi:hypothetical protein
MTTMMCCMLCAVLCSECCACVACSSKLLAEHYDNKALSMGGLERKLAAKNGWCHDKQVRGSWQPNMAGAMISKYWRVMYVLYVQVCMSLHVVPAVNMFAPGHLMLA